MYNFTQFLLVYCIYLTNIIVITKITYRVSDYTRMSKFWNFAQLAVSPLYNEFVP